ncbi:hypothetical protein [Lewinella sp. IMCC34183]|uniref:hypothetical protein n=1 Tax=Lewinella sp. IMCC34183 TaxID=2248762 RepID=UPI000E26485F|nr:hypothetical protein [Lewinella sp. IMCC34183]
MNAVADLRAVLQTTLLILLVAVTPTALAAQSDEVVLTDGSVLQVNVRRVATVDGARQLTYRGPDGKTRTLAPANVESYHLEGGDRHFRTVEVSLPDPETGRITRQRRFGEVLASGDVELVKVALSVSEYPAEAADSRPYLYLLRRDDVELVLKLTSIRVYDRPHANPSRFRNLLKFFVGDCYTATELARDARFYDSDILQVIDAYAGCGAGREVALDRNRLSGTLEIEHHVRASYLDSRDGDFSDQQFSAGLGYQASTHFVDRFRWLSILASVDYIYQSFRWQEASDVQQTMLRGNLSVGFIPLDIPGVRLQVTGGLSNYNALTSSFRSFFSNNYFLLNGGLTVDHGNFRLSLQYEHLPGQIQRRPGSQLLTSLGYRLRW